MRKIFTVLMFFIFIWFYPVTSPSQTMYVVGQIDGNWGPTHQMNTENLGGKDFFFYTLQATSDYSNANFLFESDGYYNKWDDVNSDVNVISTYIWHNNNGGNDNAITSGVTNGNFYTFRLENNGYSNAMGVVMETSAMPVDITSVSDNFASAGIDVTVSITLSGSTSGENVFVRYTTDGWNTSSILLATGSGTSYSATIPGTDVNGTSQNDYYVLTSTLSLSALGSTNVDLATISYNNNGGSNFPLPVELTTFTAFAKNKEVKLNWQTATEVNNYGFNIERKLDAGDWNKIAFVEGHGNSNSPKYYSFTDKLNETGKYSYRLKQVDIDGSFEYSKVVEAIIEIPNNLELAQNYPNPFNPTTDIKFSLPETGNISLVVYNVIGEQVAELLNQKMDAGYHTVKFDGSNLTSGLYIYRLQTEKSTLTKKMILMK
jgi:hypothetical protein